MLDRIVRRDSIYSRRFCPYYLRPRSFLHDLVFKTDLTVTYVVHMWHGNCLPVLGPAFEVLLDEIYDRVTVVH